MREDAGEKERKLETNLASSSGQRDTKVNVPSIRSVIHPPEDPLKKTENDSHDCTSSTQRLPSVEHILPSASTNSE